LFVGLSVKNLNRKARKVVLDLSIKSLLSISHFLFSLSLVDFAHRENMKQIYVASLFVAALVVVAMEVNMNKQIYIASLFVALVVIAMEVGRKHCFFL
jgi:hypothetical protein